MGYDSRQIDREVYGAVPETCPKVDAALETAAAAIKEQTGLLRDALRDYVERALNAEDELEDANRRIAELEEYVSSLERDLAQVDA